jgi:hypothetical protein
MKVGDVVMVRSRLHDPATGLGLILAVREKIFIEVLYEGSVRFFHIDWLELV